MLYHLKCQSPYFEQIQAGSKTIEGRLAKEKFLQIAVGDTLCFNDTLMVCVKAIRRYNTFEEMIRQEGCDKVVPGYTSSEYVNSAPFEAYRQFYSAEDEKMYGVIALEIQRLPFLAR